jgi:hypothetical protein
VTPSVQALKFVCAVVLGRVIEDYAVIYCGSAVFKISRLLLIAMMCAPSAFYCHAIRVTNGKVEQMQTIAVQFLT